MISTLDDLQFDNRFTRDLPADPETSTGRRQVTGACYSRVVPATVADPRLVAHSAEMLEQLGMDPKAVDDPLFAQVFSGNLALDGMDTHAMCYGGHQFGNWAGQLGDGRAIALGEVVDAGGHIQMLQLKGAGPTPYSRTADGLAVLRSSIREFLCSEAMLHLGVPTTRALSVVTTGEQVVRDMLYDGNARPEPGAVVCRVAPSFVRFGNFEIFSARGDHDTLRQLTDFVITSQFPDLGAPSKGDPDVYVEFFAEVARRTARLIVEWLRVGFVHGVMNTDNMSILGLTIDYGPYGWLDDYDPEWTPNTTDAANRRYRFGLQAQVAQWNLVQLANALFPLVGAVEPLQEALDAYGSTFQRGWAEMMAAKLGLPGLDSDADRQLAAEVLQILQLVETDMSIFWRRLATVQTGQDIVPRERVAALADAHYMAPAVSDAHWARIEAFGEDYAARLTGLGIGDVERQVAMDRVNPKFVLRNYLAQLAIDQAEAGDSSLVTELLDVMRRPYDDQPQYERHAELRPDWARTRVGCSQLSCSS